MAFTWGAFGSSVLGIDRSQQNQQSLDIEAKKLSLNEKIIDKESKELQAKQNLIITLVIIFAIALFIFLFFYLKK